MSKSTPLFDTHVAANAKMTDFSGWEMPLSYGGSSQKEEHLAVRNDCGIFDVSHMGEARVRGADAEKFLDAVCSNNISKIKPGRAQYNLLLNERAGVVDDIIVYRISDEEFFLCLNAGNTEIDINWLSAKLKASGFDCEFKDESKDYAQVAVQGPKAVALLAGLFGQECEETKKFGHFTQQTSDYGELFFARTGYTGEDGFEIFLKPESSEALWRDIVAKGAKPAGLSARDTLRLEAALPLHGHELGPDIPAAWSNVSWAVKPDKGEFIGKDRFVSDKQKLEKKLCGLEVTGKGIVREEMKLLSGETEVGWVTSGTMTPSVGKAIALAYIDCSLVSDSSLSRKVVADVRGRAVSVEKCGLPFLK